GIFVNRLVCRWPDVLAGPGPVPSVWVFYREAIQKRFLVNARQALDDMEVFRRSTKPGFVSEIGCVDNQRVPFPVTNRIPHPTADILGKMVHVHPHDTYIVHHLRKNHDRVWSLHDLMQIVIKIVWERWRARRRTEPKNAAFAKGPLLRIVKSPRRLCPHILALARLGRWRCRSRGEALPRRRTVRRYMAAAR